MVPPAAALWIHPCIHMEATVTRGCFRSVWLNMVEILSQGHSWERASWADEFVSRTSPQPHWNSLELHCSLKCFLPYLPSFPLSFTGVRPASWSDSFLSFFWLPLHFSLPGISSSKSLAWLIPSWFCLLLHNPF